VVVVVVSLVRSTGTAAVVVVVSVVLVTGAVAVCSVTVVLVCANASGAVSAQASAIIVFFIFFSIYLKEGD
jgi:hypothetical protein